MEGDNQKRERYWTSEEHDHFLEAIKLYGESNLVEISKYVGTRTRKQVESHMTKYRKAKREGRQMKVIYITSNSIKCVPYSPTPTDNNMREKDAKIETARGRVRKSSTDNSENSESISESELILGSESDSETELESVPEPAA